MHVRERVAAYGPKAASDAELLALAMGIHETIALEALNHAGSLRQLVNTSVDSLREVFEEKRADHIAEKVGAIGELSRRIASIALQRGERISCSRDIQHAYGPRLSDTREEQFWVILLDARNRMMSERLLYTGAITSCPVEPGDVFRHPVREGASSVIFLHNHPSGKPEPSPEDVALTERLSRAGSVLGIRVVDHIIIGGTEYFSFLDAGLLEPPKRETV